MTFHDEVTNAMTCHTTWKNRLRQVIEIGIVDLPADVIRSDKECAFGKWLHGDTLSAANKRSIQYKKVVDLHSQFHILAAQIVELVEAGDKMGAKRKMETGSEYAFVSAELTLALIEWKRSLLQ